MEHFRVVISWQADRKQILLNICGLYTRVKVTPCRNLLESEIYFWHKIAEDGIFIIHGRSGIEELT